MPPVFDPGDVDGFGTVEVSIDGEILVLALADDSGLRGRGLMGVADLGDFDGMLFTWGGETVTTSFTMRNTLIDIDVAFFDADGQLVGVQQMVPCTDDPCPSYSAPGPYSAAVEVAGGGFDDLAPDAVLEIGDVVVPTP